MRSLRPGARIAVLAACALVVGGCGLRAEPVADDAGRYPVTVLDAADRSVAVGARPSRIVAVGRAAQATLAALGATATAVLPGAVASITPASADLVVVPIEQIDQVPAGVTSFAWGGGDLARSGRQIAALALAVGAGAQGVDLATRLDAEIRTIVQRSHGEQRVRAMLESGPLQSLGSDSAFGRVAATLGATPLTTTTESLQLAVIANRDPQVWISTRALTMSLTTLRRTEKLRDTAAAKDRRFAVFDPTTLAPSPDLPKALSELVRILHPATG